jgi:excisionase family DNA binding protein
MTVSKAALPPMKPAPERNTVFESATMSVADASRVLGLSKNSTYRAINRGEIPSLRFGRRIVVASHRLREMLGLDDSKKLDGSGSSTE